VHSLTSNRLANSQLTICQEQCGRKQGYTQNEISVSSVLEGKYRVPVGTQEENKAPELRPCEGRTFTDWQSVIQQLHCNVKSYRMLVRFLRSRG
jgi:hypothetical protein